MKTLRFEITITLSGNSELSEDDVAAKLSDAVGSFGDDDPSIIDFDVQRRRRQLGDAE